MCLLLALLLFAFISRAPGVEYRSYDGMGNNPSNANSGQAGEVFSRHEAYTSRYALDNATLVTGLPSPRVVSNALAAACRKLVDPRRLSDAYVAWGHFITIDMIDTAAGQEERAPIPVPPCDLDLDPACSGTATLAFTRSAFVLRHGERHQVNRASAFLDGAPVYGTDAQRARSLRALSGGRMLMGPGGTVPFNTAGLFMLDLRGLNASESRMLGDYRSSVTPQNLALHSLFLREHNRVCAGLQAAHPTWGDEQLYQEARRRVVALIQHVTVTEYLPALLGYPLPLYAGYDPAVDPAISSFFATVAYRHSHPEVNGLVPRLTKDWVTSPGGNLPLREAVFNPPVALSEGVEPLLRGMLFSAGWMVQPAYDDAMRNHALEVPGKVPPMDVMSLDIQRGRDHGMPAYNDARRAFGLPPKATFEEITTDPAIAGALKALYGDVGRLDALVGALAETPPYAGVGELAAASVVEQYHRLRAGDRFWYQNQQFEPGELDALQATRLVDVINRNTDIGYTVRSAFFRHDAGLGGGMFQGPLPLLPVLEAEYMHALDLNPGFRLYWRVDDVAARVHFAAVAVTHGWMGLGFALHNGKEPLHSAMYHVDMALGRLVQGESRVEDYFSFELGRPALDVDLGCEDDLQHASLEVNGSLRTMRFSKPFRCPDSDSARGRLGDGMDPVKAREVVHCDTALTPGLEYYVIFALNPVEDALVYHGAAQGVNRVVLIPVPGWKPLHTLIAALGGALALFLVVGVGGLLLWRRRGKNNALAPRAPPFCILFTDIEQSTLLWSLEESTMKELIEVHTRVIRRAIAAHRAFEVKTIGDSFMVVLPDPVRAVRLALDIQLELCREGWSPRVLRLLDRVFPPGTEDNICTRMEIPHAGAPHETLWHGPRVRIGVHYASVNSGVLVTLDRVSGGVDYLGPPVNAAARVESLAHGGQTLLSGSLVAHCPGLLTDPELVVQAMGLTRVKGVPLPIEVYQVAPLPLAQRTFPPLKTSLTLPRSPSDITDGCAPSSSNCTMEALMMLPRRENTTTHSLILNDSMNSPQSMELPGTVPLDIPVLPP